MREFRSVSASQLYAYRDCNRLWWFQSVLGLETPQRASAALGSEVHAHLERYLDDGTLPPDTASGKIARAGLSLLPEPGSVFTEVKIKDDDHNWPRPEIAGIPVNGFVDVLGLSGSVPLVLDHKCLPASAVVHTRNGPVRVGDLSGDWECAAWAGTQIVRARASAPSDGGIQRVFNVRLKNGMSGRYGETHPLLTRRGWVQAADIRPVDTVAVALDLPDTDGVPVPDALIKATAMLLCDGALTSDALTYTKTGAARAEYIRCLSELGIPFWERGLSRPGRAPYVQVSASATSPLRVMLQEIGVSFVGSADRCVPPVLMGMNRRQIGVFLGGMWSGDGAAYIVRTGAVSKPVVTFAGRSRRLCEDVRNLLLRVGIPATFTITSAPYKGRRVPYYAATVVGKKGKVDFLRRAIDGEIAVADRCSGRLTRARNVPPPLTDVLRAAESMVDYPAGGLPIRIEGPIWWVPVADVAAEPPEQCFDIEVPTFHTFVAEGVVTHNTTSDLKYAKNEGQLRNDPQIVIYGRFALDAACSMGADVDRVDAGHVVYLTKGAPLARKTMVTLTRADLNAAWPALEVDVRAMKDTAKITTPDAVPGNRESCNNYGGCHFRDRCRALGMITGPEAPRFITGDTLPVGNPQDTQASAYQPSTTTQESTMSVDPLAALAALKARRAGTPVASPEPAPAPAAPAAIPEPSPAPAAVDPRAAILAKYGIKPPTATAPAAQSIVPADAPPQALPAAFGGAPKAEAAPTPSPAPQEAPVASPAGTTRRPKGYADKLAALNWTPAQIDRMLPDAMREAIDGNLDGTRYTVLKDGTLALPASPAPVEQAAPAESAEPAPVAAPAVPAPVEQAAPVAAPAEPRLVLYIDCEPVKGRERTYRLLEDVIAPLLPLALDMHNRGAKESERADFYSLIPYARGPGYVAALVMKNPPTGVLVCNSRAPATGAVLEVLVPMADVVVRALR